MKETTKFLGLRLQRLKEQLLKCTVNIIEISGTKNRADQLTKPVTKVRFYELQELLQGKKKLEELLKPESNSD